MQKKIFFILVIMASILLGIDIVGGELTIPGGDRIKEVSITSSIGNKESITIDKVRGFGGDLLSIARLVISGIALIYMVIIGANMIIHSEDDGEIAKQKKQIFYTVFAFLFLNVPDIVYRLFMSNQRDDLKDGSWQDTSYQSPFWNNDGGSFGVQNFIGGMLDFLKVTAFIVAVASFAWGAYQFIVSRGKDDYKANAQNRMVYGVLGLIFLGIVEAWSYAARQTDLQNSIANVAGNLFSVAFFFAAPVAVLFLIIGAYYYITSAGDEERAKKGKNIFLYTLIASLILLAGFSFIEELLKVFR